MEPFRQKFFYGIEELYTAQLLLIYSYRLLIYSTSQFLHISCLNAAYRQLIFSSSTNIEGPCSKYTLVLQRNTEEELKKPAVCISLMACHASCVLINLPLTFPSNVFPVDFEFYRGWQLFILHPITPPTQVFHWGNRFFIQTTIWFLTRETLLIWNHLKSCANTCV